MSTARLTPRLALLMTLPPLLWAGNAVVGRLMVGHVPPMALNALRWTLAALILAPLAWRVWRDAAAIRASWVYLLALGTFGVGSFNALQYLALETSTPSIHSGIEALISVTLSGVEVTSARYCSELNAPTPSVPIASR
jgi:drug/metabolite transporter (DMT)-like permease